MKEISYQKNYEFEDNFWWFVGRKQIIKTILDGMTPKHQEIVDIGCGTGGTTDILNKYGNVKGLDSSEVALSYCKKRGLTNIELYTPPEVPIKEKSVDLITLFDVLEHIENDKAFLKTLNCKIKPKGYLLLTVPTYDALWSGEDDVSLHFRRYNKRKLVHILNETNFRIVRFSYFNFFLLPAIYLIIKLSKFTNKAHESNLRPLLEIINKCLTNILKFESYLIKELSLPFGASAIVLAQIDRKT